MMDNLKPCPILVASPDVPSTLCMGHHCAWWCGFSGKCAVKLIADILAESNRRAKNGRS